MFRYDSSDDPRLEMHGVWAPDSRLEPGEGRQGDGGDKGSHLQAQAEGHRLGGGCGHQGGLGKGGQEEALQLS